MLCIFIIHVSEGPCVDHLASAKQQAEKPLLLFAAGAITTHSGNVYWQKMMEKRQLMRAWDADRPRQLLTQRQCDSMPLQMLLALNLLPECATGSAAPSTA